MVAKIVILVEVLSPSYGVPVVNTAHQARSTTPVRTVTHALLRLTTLGWAKIHAGVAINTSMSNSDAMVKESQTWIHHAKTLLHEDWLFYQHIKSIF